MKRFLNNKNEFFLFFTAKAFLKKKFQSAAMRFMKVPVLLKTFRSVMDPFSHYVNPVEKEAPVQKQDVKKRKYEAMFQAAAKRLIVERKLANPNADPWDVFFYKFVKIDAEDATFRIDIDKSKLDEFLYEEESAPSPIPDYETDIASLATDRYRLMALTPPPMKRVNSPPPERPKRTPSLPAINRQTVLLHKRRMDPVKESRKSPIRLELPRVHDAQRSKSPKATSSAVQNVRWKITRVRHSPDGKTTLNRLFYLPDITQKPSYNMPFPVNDIMPHWGFNDYQF
ncbi:hypothetical protein L596_016390 [Steinernema carpocapsae]|uniref:Uncharacterized protein n=1 Tax=Steinernema carpocapsae TaxID=34508 RepID=A0A4U5NIL5_STECR|nr:hypothetical protein L596_016390 [Steinernema carpocapsae]